MSQEPDATASVAGSLKRGRFTYLPVAPGRLEFSAEVRRLILRDRPQVVAVELPDFLREACLKAVERLPEMSVLVYPDEAEDSGIFVPVEPADPFIEAVRSGTEAGAEILFAEPGLGARPHLPDAVPDPYSLRFLGIEKYVELYRVHRLERGDAIAGHAAGMAWKIQGADPLANVLVVVSLNLLDALLDAMEIPQDAPPARRRHAAVELFNPHPDCLAEITTEYPFLQERYELHRRQPERDELLERPRVQLELYRQAERSYVENTGDTMTHWQRRLLARYTRNLALSGSSLTAGLFDLTVAARSIVDDNFAWDVWQTANSYRWQQETTEPETLNLSGEHVWLNTRRLRLRRRLPRPKRRLRPAGLKARPKEKEPGEWARQLDGNSICSYPPEDLAIEEYGRWLKRSVHRLISQERLRVEPFTTSLLDGIDIRETIRNWHENKIYVRQCEKAQGEVGAVVVIFDEDREDRYSYLTTWLGEHQNESDMAFYSTDPFAHPVGPGVGRAEYGGFLMTLPPRRLFDVWGDPDYTFAETKPERLLLAALDYSLQKHVVYAAPKPPRSVFRTIAARLDRSILYVPLGQLSPSRLKKIRVVHVLDSYERRKTAKEYIW